MKKNKRFDQSRRDFMGATSSLFAASLLMDPFEVLRQENLNANVLNNSNSPATPINRLSWKAHRGTSFEGTWKPNQFEGSFPKELNGTLFRNGPGTKVVGQTNLRHFFDGDGYVTSLQIRDGQIFAQSKFIATKERSDEQRLGKILYHDFGTGPKLSARGYKNNPNINVVPFAGQILALSEGGAPTAVNPSTLATEGLWNFSGSLPEKVGFTAHPKVDPKTGDMYAYGVAQAMFPSLEIFKISKSDNKVRKINSYSLGGFYPVHDMMITENYIVFVIPPLKVSLMGAAMKRAPIADLLEYSPKSPLRIVVFKKDGSGEPLVITSSPAAMVYHHVNAYEDAVTGNIIFESMMIDDSSVFEVFKTWSSPNIHAGPQSWMTRFEVSLKEKKVLSRTKLSDGLPTDFPCIDNRLLGQKNRFSYAVESSMGSMDPLAFNGLVCWDHELVQPHRIKADVGQAFGEPLFVPHPGSSANDPEAAWILHLGYDENKDQTFLDVRKAVSLELISRAWLGQFIPIGFHGCFLQE